jgi:hypothetical protein
MKARVFVEGRVDASDGQPTLSECPQARIMHTLARAGWGDERNMKG